MGRPIILRLHGIGQLELGLSLWGGDEYDEYEVPINDAFGETELAAPEWDIPALAARWLDGAWEEKFLPYQPEERSVVCCARDIGGIVLKQALLIGLSAEEGSQRYKIADSVTTLIFVDTPHGETASAPWETILFGLLSRLRNDQGAMDIPSASALAELARYQRRLCREFSLIQDRFKIIQYGDPGLPVSVSTIGSETEETVVVDDIRSDMSSVLSHKTHMNYLLSICDESFITRRPQYKRFLRFLRPLSLQSYRRPSREFLFHRTANLVFSEGPPRSWLQSPGHPPLILHLPPVFAQRIFSDSLLAHLSSLKSGPFRKHAVISAKLEESDEVEPTAISLLSTLIYQILLQCPGRWMMVEEMHPGEDMKAALAGEYAHLLEPLLWRYLTALLAGRRAVSIICVLSYFSSVGNSTDNHQGTDPVSKFQTIRDFARRLLAITKLVDSDFKLLVARPAGLPVPFDESIAVPHAVPHTVSCDASFGDRIKDDVTEMIDTMIQRRPVLNPSRAKLLGGAVKLASSNPALPVAFTKYVQHRAFASRLQLSDDIRRLTTLEDVFKAALGAVPDSARPQVRTALLFISHAVRPLSREELASVIGIAHWAETLPAGEDPDTVLFDIDHDLSTYLSALVYINGQEVHLAHPVLKGILCRKASDTTGSPEPWYYAGPHPHVTIATCCLQVLKIGIEVQLAVQRRKAAKAKLPEDSHQVEKTQDRDPGEGSGGSIKEAAADGCDEKDGGKESDEQESVPHNGEEHELAPDSTNWGSYKAFFDYSVDNWIAHYSIAMRRGATEKEAEGIALLLNDNNVSSWLLRLCIGPMQSWGDRDNALGLQRPPSALAARTRLPLYLAMGAMLEATRILPFVGGKEDVALTWGIAKVEGKVNGAKRFWREEVAEDLRDKSLLLPCFGREPDLAFELLSSLDATFVLSHAAKLLFYSLNIGAAGLLKHILDSQLSPAVLGRDDLIPENGWTCAGLGFSEVIVQLLNHPARASILSQKALAGGGSPEDRKEETPGGEISNTPPDPVRVLNSLMHIATASGNVGAVNLLLTRGAHVDAPDSTGTTSVAMASRHGFGEILGHILPKSSEPHRQDSSGRTPLYSASEHGYTDIASMLLERGADPFMVEEGTGTPALMAAVRSRNTHLVKLYLESPFRPRDNSEQGPKPPSTSSEAGVSNTESATEAEAAAKTVTETMMETQVIYRKNSWTGIALTQAIDKGCSETALALVEGGVPLDEADIDNVTVVHLAARAGMHDVLGAILERNTTDINAKSREHFRYTPLQEASSAGHSACISILLDKGADVTIGDNRNRTPIEITAHRKHLEAARALLKVKHEPRALGEALENAVIANHAKLVTLLLDAGADKDYADVNQSTALQIAAYFRRPQLVELLLLRQPNLEMRDDVGRSALADAARRGAMDVVRLLLAAGANIDVEDRDGKTPFELAVGNNYFDVAALLLSSGAETGDDKYENLLLKMIGKSNHEAVAYLVRNRQARLSDSAAPTLSSALLRAIENRKPDMVTVLLDCGADPDDPNVADRDDPSDIYGSPLLMATWRGYKDVVQRLLDREERRADVNLTRPWYWTALESAVSGVATADTQLDMFCFLLEHGADPTISGGPYGTLLGRIAARGCPAVAEQLVDICLEKGLKLDDKDSEGRTPAHCAAMGGNDALFDRLLSLPLEEDKQGRTPAHLAAGNGSLLAVRHLIEHADDPAAILQKPDVDGWNALHWACRQKDREVVGVILGAAGAAGAAGIATVRTKDGQLAEEIAVFHNNGHFVTLLRQSAGDTEPLSDEEDERLRERAWERRDRECDSCHCAVYGENHQCQKCKMFVLCFKCFKNVGSTVYGACHVLEPTEEET